MSSGVRAKSLLVEMRRSEFLPPYNEETVRVVVEETKQIFKQLRLLIDTVSFEDGLDPAIAIPLIVHQEGVSRNKRCLLAYLNTRLERIEKLRHEYGSVVPPDVIDLLSSKELDYFKAYGRLLERYMATVELDLTADLQPPKRLFVEVRVMKDYGEIMTDSGPVVLKKDELLLLRRSDVEHLIRQGVLQERTVGR